MKYQRLIEELGIITKKINKLPNNNDSEPLQLLAGHMTRTLSAERYEMYFKPSITSESTIAHEKHLNKNKTKNF